MSGLNMRIIIEETGFGATFTWANEIEYHLGQKFLSRVGARLREPPESTGNNPACYYVQTERQYLDFLNFRRSLRAKS